MASDPPHCEYCGTFATQKCTGCKLVFYCGKEHQILDWKKEHKSKCKAYEIAESKSFGRYMRSIRSIRAGDVILREAPLILGPKIISVPICLGCHQYVRPQDIPINGLPISPAPSSSMRNRNRKPKVKTQRNYYKCSTCKWPVCSAECEKLPTHLAECQLMAEKKFECSINYNAQDENRKESAYCAILPLRCLLQKKSTADGFAKFFELQDHLNERIGTPIYSILKTNLITFFKTILSLEEFDETTILKTAAILDTNSFEVRTPDGCSKIRGIYAETAMMSHDCVPNSYHSFDENMQITIRAAVDIKKGDVISLSYCQPLQSTMQRRIYLRHSKCFDCMCQRCQDSTECGTFIGSLLCPSCKSEKLLPDHPFDVAANWNCPDCTYQMSAMNFQYFQKRLQFAIENLDKHSPYDYEMFLEKYSYRQSSVQTNGSTSSNGSTDDIVTSDILLHEQNTFALQIKYALTQLYGNVSGFLWHEIGDTDLKRKISLCQELLNVAAILEPGQSIFRGKLLVDLQDALAVQLDRRLNNGEISKVVAREKYIEQLHLLDEAVGIFKDDASMKVGLAKRLKDMTIKIQQPTV